MIFQSSSHELVVTWNTEFITGKSQNSNFETKLKALMDRKPWEGWKAVVLLQMHDNPFVIDGTMEVMHLVISLRAVE